MSKMNEANEFCPANKQEWRNWLELNHVREDSVWVIFYKKKSPDHNLTWSESVDEALCFGWIDSVIYSIDSERSKQYFSKRKPNSNWSKINKAKVKDLIDQGLMREAGYKTIEIAKANGSWTLLDAVEELVVPQDLTIALSKFEGASVFFEGLSKSNKKILLYWIVSAKRPETRLKRILEVAENAGNNLRPPQFR